MREKIEQEKEKSEAPKMNRKKKSDTRERKSDTHEKKINCLEKASEVRKVLLAREPLYLLYCKDSKIFVDNCNELTIYISPSFELLLQEFKDVFPKEIPHELPPSRGIEHQIDFLLGASLPNRPAYRRNPKRLRRFRNKCKTSCKKGGCKKT